MIDSVTRTSAVYAELPHKFEAGTVNAAGAAGLKAAIDYIEKVGFDYIGEREITLTSRAIEKMKKNSSRKYYRFGKCRRAYGNSYIHDRQCTSA